MNAPRSSNVLPLVLLVVSLLYLQTGPMRAAVAKCQGGSTYLVEADSGGFYALVGLPSSLRYQYENHTARISVNGTYYPASPSEYLHPDPNFRGVIYVTQYAILSASSTTTFTNSRPISQTTITVATGKITLTPIGVTGILDYTNQYCVTPLFATATTSSTEGNSGQPISGFTIPSIILGFIIGILLLRHNRSRAHLTVSSIPSYPR